ncbi:MAG: hypothetical protein DRJ66_03940 [Thermoprotei archaeon]|nr:MAG: hypothetical protein DRJ66_03940 [Thermoprotei archaeon]
MIEPLRLLIEDYEEEAVKFFSNILSRIGLTPLRPLKSLLLSTLILSILDSKRWSWHIFSLESVVKETWRFISHVGDMDDIALFKDLDLLETAIEDTEKLIRLSDIDRTNFVDTIRFFAMFLSSVKTDELRDFYSFSSRLRAFVMDKLSIMLSEEAYKHKARYFGQLVVLDREQSYRISQMSLLCFPIVDLRTSDTYLYLLGKVLKIWNNPPLSKFHCPMDPSVIRVGVRIGLFSKKFKTSRHGGFRYRIFQNIARDIFPNDPTKLYVLRYIGETLCKSHKQLCEGCPFFGICKYYIMSEEV